MSQPRVEPSLISSETFADKAPRALLLTSDSVFRYCTFKQFSAEHPAVEGTFLRCAFENTDWYWTHFNMCVFSRCVFRNSVFRGVTFSDARFVECVFENCSFTKNNLGTDCDFSASKFFGCERTATTGLPNW